MTNLKEKMIIGIKIRTSNEKAQNDIPAHWGKFFAEGILDKIPNKLSSDMFSIYTEYEGDFTKPYSYVLGCEVSTLKDIPSGMVGFKIPAANYEVFSAKGEFPTAIIETWQKIWASDINRAYTADFEIYPESFSPEGESEIKIYIALK